jgi:hypothetical protein
LQGHVEQYTVCLSSNLSVIHDVVSGHLGRAEIRGRYSIGHLPERWKVSLWLLLRLLRVEARLAVSVAAVCFPSW